MLFGFRNISIISKIAVPATIIAVVSIGIVLYASLSVTNLSETAAALVDRNATRVQFALQAESNFNSAAVSEKNVILSAADGNAARANIEAYNKATAAALNAIGRLEAITPDADQHGLIETFRTAVNPHQEVLRFRGVVGGDCVLHRHVLLVRHARRKSKPCAIMQIVYYQ